MAETDPGDRFPLLLYRQVIGGLRAPTFLLALLLLGLWAAVLSGRLDWPPETTEPWLLAGGLVSLAAWLMAWLGPRSAYVQARADHLRVQTPIYRMKVSYRRIHNTRPIDLVRVFPPSSTRRGWRRILWPFYGGTALGVDLRGYPLAPLTMRLFFHPLLFTPDQSGLLLIVRDWMGLSRQLSARLDLWRSAQQVRPRGTGIGAAAILEEE